MDFSVTCHRTGNVGVIDVAGELDAEAAGQFAAGVHEALRETADVVVDLQRTTFVDCRGLSTLLRLQRETRSRGGRLRTVGACPSVLLLFGVFDVTDLLGGRRSVDDELRSPLTSAGVGVPQEERCAVRR